MPKGFHAHNSVMFVQYLPLNPVHFHTIPDYDLVSCQVRVLVAFHGVLGSPTAAWVMSDGICSLVSRQKVVRKSYDFFSQRRQFGIRPLNLILPALGHLGGCSIVEHTTASRKF